MVQEHVTQATLAALGAAQLVAIVACAVMLAAILRYRPVRGWFHIRPAVSHWFAGIGSWALSLLIGWVWLFVGSARRDAQEQMLIAFVLALCFTLAAAYMFAHIAKLLRDALRWDGAVVAWRAKGVDHNRELADAIELESGWSGLIRVRFADGECVSIDPNAGGSTELLDALAGVIEENWLDPDGTLFR